MGRGFRLIVSDRMGCPAILPAVLREMEQDRDAYLALN